MKTNTSKLLSRDACQHIGKQQNTQKLTIYGDLALFFFFLSMIANSSPGCLPQATEKEFYYTFQSASLAAQT